jgi:hypothetical protein
MHFSYLAILFNPITVSDLLSLSTWGWRAGILKDLKHPSCSKPEQQSQTLSSRCLCSIPNSQLYTAPPPNRNIHIAQCFGLLTVELAVCSLCMCSVVALHGQRVTLCNETWAIAKLPCANKDTHTHTSIGKRTRGLKLKTLRFIDLS